MAGAGSLASDYIRDKLLRLKLKRGGAIIGRRARKGAARVKGGDDARREGEGTTVHCVCFHSLHETGRSLTLPPPPGATLINKGPTKSTLISVKAARRTLR